MGKIQTDKKRMVFMAGTYVLTVGLVAITSFLYGLIINQIITNTIMTGIVSGLLLFAMQQEFLKGLWEYDNAIRWMRYLGVYFITLLISLLLPMLPSVGWFFPVLAVALACYSNTIIGIVGSSLLVMISVLLSGSFVGMYILYFVCNMTAIFAFRKLDDKFMVGIPLFISMSILFIATVAMDILFIPGKLTIEVFIIPVINVFISSVLLLILLKNFSISVVHKYRNRYITINDQEFVLLSELKQKDKDTYYHCIHTAYLCERIATQLNLNVPLAKAGGYYHKIGKLKGENTAEQVNAIIVEKNFPSEVCDLLIQYLDKKVKLTGKEGGILLFADAVITTMQYFFVKDKNAKLDYEQIISAIFQKKIDAGNLNDSMLTIEELIKMKKILIKEQLYYDFLR